MRRRNLGRGALTAAAFAIFAVLAAPSPVGPASAATPGAAGSTTTGSTTPVPAYWMVATDGGIFSFGGAKFYGSTGSIVLNKPIVGMAATADGGGYWLVASDGGIFSYGDAQFYGSTGSLKLNKPIVDMAATPDGRGYWMVATDGGVFSFGDAKFYGSTGSIKLNQPIVGMAATPDGHGYWLVASDGGIFSYGDATFFGSTGGTTLNKPIIAMLAGPNGTGYILVASDGGTFSYGTAPFYGSLGGVPLKNPIVAAATTPGDTGYWFSDVTGEVSAFGQASYYGSAPSPLNKPIVAMAEAPGTGAFVGAPYPSGSYGYDYSIYQCGNYKSVPGEHNIGIVQVDGASSAATNPCLAAEASWAGAGLNLYTFLSYGTSTTPEGNCSSDQTLAETQACNFGYAAGLHAFQDAVSAGVNTAVAWWLDVEGTGNWSSSTQNNMALVQGTLTALRNAEGIANVGIYASPGNWNSIVGNYQPSVPYWMADYLANPSGPGTCADAANWEAKKLLPTGPVEVVQYNSQQYDEDYAC